MSARWWTFLVWAAVAASAAAWGLKVFVQPPPVPPQALVAMSAPAARGDLTPLLGADPPPPEVVPEAPAPAADARFQLVGVVSPRSPQAAREGLALIAVDGKPPRAYRVGAVVEGPHVLQAVDARGATLGPRGGAARIALKLPPPAAAATGVLPALSARGGPGVPPQPRAPAVPPAGQGDADDEPEQPPPPPPPQGGRAVQR